MTTKVSDAVWQALDEGVSPGSVQDAVDQAIQTWEPKVVTPPPPPRNERCGCKSGDARNPGTHNNQIRNQGRCYCSCHSR